MVTRRRSPTVDSTDDEMAVDHLPAHLIKVPLHVRATSHEDLQRQRHRQHHEHLSDGEEVEHYPGDDMFDDEDNHDHDRDGNDDDDDAIEGGIAWSRRLSHCSSNSSGSSFDYGDGMVTTATDIGNTSPTFYSDHNTARTSLTTTTSQPSSPPEALEGQYSSRLSSSSSRINGGGGGGGGGAGWNRSSSASIHNAIAMMNKHNNNNISNISNNNNNSPPLFLVGLILIGVVAAYLSRSSVGFAVQRASELAATRTQLADKLFKTEKDLASLKREMMAMNALISQQERAKASSQMEQDNQRKQQEATHELGAVQDRIQNLHRRGQSLKDRVQSMSRHELTSKYGAGTKFVELELVFPQDEHHRASDSRHANMKGGGGPTKFVIQLAADQDMPHSVFTFLEMVSYQLLDGCSFILNALHVLKAAPLPYDGSLAAAKAKAFAEHGLESVAFREYNPSYPHKKYTVGFAADGSPSFYINTEDNADIHVGDPCFGTIVAGFDTVQRLEASPTRNGIWFAQKIGIKTARRVPDPNQKGGPALRQAQPQNASPQQQQQQQESSSPVEGSSHDTAAVNGNANNGNRIVPRLRQSDSSSADK